MRGLFIMAAIVLLLASACDGTDTDTALDFWAPGNQDARRTFVPIRGPWEQLHVGSGRERHVVRADARLRPHDEPTAVQVDLDGVGEAQVILFTADGWVIASCGGYVDNSSLVCLSTATQHEYSGIPHVEVWTPLHSPNRPTPIGGHIRLGAP